MLSLLTTILDLAGMLLIVAGLAIAVAIWLSLPFGVVLAGVGLLQMSWLIDQRAQAAARRARAAAVAGGAA